MFGYSLLNRMFPDHLSGRAWGAFHAAGACVVAIGSLLAPALASRWGLTGAMVLTGTLLAAAPWLTWPWFCAVDDRAAGRSEDVDLIRRVPMLAPMSLIGLERLARDAQPVTAAAGETVIGEGEPADCFYVIAEGTLSVSMSDVPVAASVPGPASARSASSSTGPVAPPSSLTSRADCCVSTARASSPR